MSTKGTPRLIEQAVFESFQFGKENCRNCSPAIESRTFELSLHFSSIMDDFKQVLDGVNPDDLTTTKLLIDNFLSKVSNVFIGAFSPEFQMIEANDKEVKKFNEIKNIIHEIVTTELDYREDLILFNQFYGPLLKNSKIIGEEIKAIEIILLRIIALSTRICEVFDIKNYDHLLKLTEDLSCYGDFFVLYATVVQKMKMVKKEFPNLETIQLTNPKLKSLSVLDILIKPIQRLTRYPLFIKSLKPLLQNNTTIIDMLNTLEFELKNVLEKHNTQQKMLSSKTEKKLIIPNLKWKHQNVDLEKSTLLLVMPIQKLSQLTRNNTLTIKGVNMGILFENVILFVKAKAHKYEVLSVLYRVDIIEDCDDAVVLHSLENTLIIQFKTKMEQNQWINQLNQMNDSRKQSREIQKQRRQTMRISPTHQTYSFNKDEGQTKQRRPSDSTVKTILQLSSIKSFKSTKKRTSTINERRITTEDTVNISSLE
ncbi:DH domain-containing protein [Entamoeba marina]